MWLFVFVCVCAAYLLLRFIKLCTADGDLTVLGSKMKPEYFQGRVVWVTGASSGSKFSEEMKWRRLVCPLPPLTISPHLDYLKLCPSFSTTFLSKMQMVIWPRPMVEKYLALSPRVGTCLVVSLVIVDYYQMPTPLL